jgi:hypothetical protein
MFIECCHILPSGKKCESPALRGKSCCYFHDRLHAFAKDGTRKDRNSLRLPMVEDACGIQMALMQVLGSLATRRISCRRAGLMLYGLQIAAQTLPHVPFIARKVVEPSCCDELELGAPVDMPPSQNAPENPAQDNLASHPPLNNPAGGRSHDPSASSVNSASLPHRRPELLLPASASGPTPVEVFRRMLREARTNAKGPDPPQSGAEIRSG